MADSDERFTPRWLFDPLHNFFRFTLDPCTIASNPLGLPTIYTIEDNGLEQSWQGHRVFVNPPYSKGAIRVWAEKCVAEASPDCFIYALVRCDCSQPWYQWLKRHSWFADEIPRRVSFGGLDPAAKSKVPFWGSVGFLLGGPVMLPWTGSVGRMSGWKRGSEPARSTRQRVRSLLPTS